MAKTELNQAEIQHIIIEKSVFLTAQTFVSVPWQAMAAIWYRESFTTATPKTPGGQFQFDPPDPPISQLKSLLIQYTTGMSSSDIQITANEGVNNFSSACILAACHLRQGAKFNLSTDHSDAAIMDAFYGYNGRAWGPSPTNSPYVMNNFDASHMNMVIRGTVPDGHGGRKWIDNIDLRPGAFTVYKQLCKLPI